MNEVELAMMSPSAFAVESTQCDSCGGITIHLMLQEDGMGMGLDVAFELTVAERVVKLLRTALAKPPIMAEHGAVTALPNWQPGNSDGGE